LTFHKQDYNQDRWIIAIIKTFIIFYFRANLIITYVMMDHPFED